MRIGILSDTHNQQRRTAAAVATLASKGAQALIHCGDFTNPEIVYCLTGLPSYIVFGNNDFERDRIRSAVADIEGICLEYGGMITLAEKRIAVTHGDRPAEFRKLLVAKPDYLLYGHTHACLNDRVGDTRQINPGALYRADEWTVALLDLVNDELEFLRIR